MLQNDSTNTEFYVEQVGIGELDFWRVVRILFGIPKLLCIPALSHSCDSWWWL